MMHPNAVEPAPERSWTLDDRLALLSVLQELTVAVLGLFDPARSIDRLLEKVAARLGCCVAVCLEAAADGRVDLLGSVGLARRRGRRRSARDLGTRRQLVPIYPGWRSESSVVVPPAARPRGAARPPALVRARADTPVSTAGSCGASPTTSPPRSTTARCSRGR
jgi:hypothetical protein